MKGSIIMTQAMTTTTNTTKRNRIVAFFLAFLMILAGIGGTAAVTAQDAHAYTNHYSTSGSRHSGSGISVCPYEAYYSGDKLILKCNVQNRTGRTITHFNYNVDVYNGYNTCIAGGHFSRNVTLQPGQMRNFQFTFDANHHAHGADLTGLKTQYSCQYN